MGAQLSFEIRTEDTGLDVCCSRYIVNFNDAMEIGHVYRDRGIALFRHIQSPNHAGGTPIRNRCEAVLLAPT